MKIAVANLKAEFNEIEIKIWWQALIAEYSSQKKSDKTIILAPPAIFLELFHSEQAKVNFNFKIASQSLSQFEKGTYTGEITAPMIRPFAQFVIIGHSEERAISQETPLIIQQKIDLANQYNLEVILCLEKPEKYSGRIYALAYEPTKAIGTGMAEDADISWQKMQKLAELTKAQYHLYGGSVNSSNTRSFVNAGFDGVLVGKKSLDPHEFLAIVNHL